MPGILASDVDNPEFVNPQRPDDALWVEFFMLDPVDKWKSEAAGKEIRMGRKVPYVKMMRPGDQTTLVVHAVRDEHKIRFPQQWMRFQIKEGLAVGPESIGWKIEDWEELKGKDEQIHDLKYRRFETVEHLAGASDAQIQQLGIGGIGLRQKAQQAIKDQRRAEFKAEMDAQAKENAELKERLAKLEAMLTPPPKDTLHVPNKGK